MNLGKADSETDEPIFVGLASWIVQDGNYNDFRAGFDAAFALEFYAASGIRKVDGSFKPQLNHIGGAEYKAWGRVVYMADDWWVIDFGVLAFREEKTPENLNIGDFVECDIYLGIDPFFYFERLGATPVAPALIADWHIEKIEIQTAPFIRHGNVLVRDAVLIGWREISETNAWKDDGGIAEYVLTCKRAIHTLRHSI